MMTSSSAASLLPVKGLRQLSSHLQSVFDPSYCSVFCGSRPSILFQKVIFTRSEAVQLCCLTRLTMSVTGDGL